MYWKLKPQGGSILPKGFIVGNYANQHCILCKFEISLERRFYGGFNKTAQTFLVFSISTMTEI